LSRKAIPREWDLVQQQATRKPGFGALLTINIIFEVQPFVASSSVKSLPVFPDR